MSVSGHIDGVGTLGDGSLRTLFIRPFPADFFETVFFRNPFRQRPLIRDLTLAPETS